MRFRYRKNTLFKLDIEFSKKLNQDLKKLK